MKRILIALILLAVPATVWAQTISRISPIVAGPASLTAANAGTCTTTGTGCLVVNIGGYAGIGVQLTGTWSGTVTFELTIDGTNWVAEDLVQTTSTTPTATTTGNGIWVGATVGSTFRVRFSTRSSGTVVASVRATMNVASSGFGTGTNGTSGAPPDATYIVQTSNGGLTAEQALSALATGVMKVTTGTGAITSAAAPTGAIVGTTDAQALSNKTGNISQWTNDSGYGLVLSATSAAIGGSLLGAGACASSDTTVTGATTAMAVAVSPSADPDPALATGVVWSAFVSAADTVTIRLCGLVAVTPISRTYNIRVIK